MTVGYWEPIATPSSHLEPPEPVEWFCDVCDKDSQDCGCGRCEACGERGEVRRYMVEDCDAWLCDPCQGAS